MQVWCCVQRDHSIPRVRPVAHACVRCGAKYVAGQGVTGDVLVVAMSGKESQVLMTAPFNGVEINYEGLALINAW